jgi:dihydrofolate reductase
VAQRPEPPAITLGLIWAQSTGGVIGRDGGLPWHLPEDLAHFRQVTLGHPVIMGRRTWESLPDRFRPLPDRRNIVLSRRSGFTARGAEVARSLAGAVALAAESAEQAWVAGGAEVFRAACDLAEVAEVTEVEVDVPGDAFAPPLAGWTLRHAGDWRTSTTGLRFRFLHLLRRIR